MLHVVRKSIVALFGHHSPRRQKARRIARLGADLMLEERITPVAGDGFYDLVIISQRYTIERELEDGFRWNVDRITAALKQTQPFASRFSQIRIHAIYTTLDFHPDYPMLKADWNAVYSFLQSNNQIYDTICLLDGSGPGQGTIGFARMGGNLACVSVNGYDPINVFFHEMGHALGGLMHDGESEKTDGPLDGMVHANAYAGQPPATDWKDLVAPDEYYAGAGDYKNWFRTINTDCFMIGIGRIYYRAAFSTVETTLLNKAMDRLASPLANSNSPSIEIVGLQNGDSIASSQFDTRINVKATDDQGINYAQLYVDGELARNYNYQLTEYSWDFSYPSSKIKPGLQQIQYKAVDAAGNVGWSQKILVNITDTNYAATTTELTLPADQQNYGTTWTATARVRFNSQAGFPVGTVQFRLDGVPFGSPVALVDGLARSPVVPAHSAGMGVIDALYLPEGNIAKSRDSKAFETVPVPLVVTVKPASRAYGMPDPAFELDYAGFIAGDGPGSLIGPPVFTTNATATSRKGNYEVRVSGLSSPNYTIEFRPGSLTITSNPVLTIAVRDVQKYYGQANPVFELTFDGFDSGDTPAILSGTNQFDSAATASSQPGAYTISASGLVSDRYEIVYRQGKMTIGKAPLKVIAQPAERMYGSANPKFELRYQGFVLNQDVSILAGSPHILTNADNVSPVGAYRIDVSDYISDLYEIEYQPGTLTIQKAPLVVAPKSTARFFGMENPFFEIEASGLMPWDDHSVLQGDAVYSTTAATQSPVGQYPVEVSGLTAQNYEIQFKPGTLTIEKAVLVITPLETNRTYGQPNPAFDLVISGFVNGDTRASLQGSPIFTTKAGPQSPAGIYDVNVSGLSSAYYDIQYHPGTITINKANLTITTAPVTRWFSQPNPAFDLVISGFVNGDTRATLQGSPVFTTQAGPQCPAGTYEVIVSGLSSAFYDIQYNPGSLTVNKAILTITTAAATRDWGQPNPAFNLVISGFVNGDTQTVLQGKAVFNTEAGPQSREGTYDVNVSGLSSNFYEIRYLPGQLTVLSSVPAAYGTFAVTSKKLLKQIEIYLTAPLRLDSATPGKFVLVGSGKDKILGTRDDVNVPIARVSYDTTFNRLSLEIAGKVTLDRDFELRSRDESVVDPLGRAIDWNNDFFRGGPLLVRLNRSGAYLLPLSTMPLNSAKTVVSGNTITAIDLTLGGWPDWSTTTRTSAYVVKTAGADKIFGTRDDVVIPLRRISFTMNPVGIRLQLRNSVALKTPIQIRIPADARKGLVDGIGRPIDGNGDGKPGDDAVLIIT